MEHIYHVIGMQQSANNSGSLETSCYFQPDDVRVLHIITSSNVLPSTGIMPLPEPCYWLMNLTQAIKLLCNFILQVYLYGFASSTESMVLFEITGILIVHHNVINKPEQLL